MAKNLINEFNSILPEYNEIIYVLEKHTQISKIDKEYKKLNLLI